MTLLESPRQTWVSVCTTAELLPGRGVAALVGTHAVALFLLDDGDVAAIDNLDPCSGASVLSRGLVGQTDLGAGPVRYVASPLRKQRFDLATGACLDAEVSVDVWPVRVEGDVVHVALEASRSGNGPETSP